MKQLVIPQSITQRDYKSLDKYFNEIDEIGLLSTHDEVMLARRIRQGDPAALERLTKANLRFVISVAKQYQHRGLMLEDLINEGNLGLIIAAKRYDDTKGFKFISYAVWWVRQSIIGAIAEHARMVRLPYNQIVLARKLNHAIAKLEKVTGCRPSNEELAECLGVPVEKVLELAHVAEVKSSISDPLNLDGELTVMDKIPSSEPLPDQFLQREAVRAEIRQSLKILSKRDRELLIMFYGIGSFVPLPLEEIGKRFNITKEHAGRLKEKALHKLRKSSHAEVLLACLD